MRILHLVTTALISAVGAAPSGAPHCLGPTCAPESDALVGQGLAHLKAYISKNGYANSTCTLENAAVRKEWYVPGRQTQTVH